jgi:hypothetical protein
VREGRVVSKDQEGEERRRGCAFSPARSSPACGTGSREAGDVEALARTAGGSAVGRRPAAEQAESRKIWGF